jgi:hypothetical protein
VEGVCGEGREEGEGEGQEEESWHALTTEDAGGNSRWGAIRYRVRWCGWGG